MGMPLMAPLMAIGLMSGTSLDGVDAALIETDGESVGQRFGGLTVSYDPSLRRRLRALLDRAATCPADDPELREAERLLTLRHADAIATLRARYPDVAVDLVGLHGQTLRHAPEEGLSWQAGDAVLLSRMTGLPVVHDFRSADVAAGGQGAPLAPLYHAALAGDHARPVVFLNIGGVANISYVGADNELLACDTGPGNALLDDWAGEKTGIFCDVDGALAAAGVVQTALLERLLAEPFFAEPPPKSLDRLRFHNALAVLQGLSAADGAATLTAFTVEAIARTPLPNSPQAWYVCGGGRRNPVLMRMLQARLGNVEPVEVLGYDGDGLEAECFGFLAVRAWRGLPLSMPGTTGVARPCRGGRFSSDGVPLPSRLSL